MSGLFGLMAIGAGALQTQQKAINVTGNNIANVNTEGYSRQKVVLETGPAVQTSIGLMAGGVTATGIERVYDRFIGDQLAGANAGLGRWEAQRAVLDRVEVVFDESDDFGLNRALSDFWGAWQDLGLNPAGSTERSMVASTGQGLADTIRAKYGDLERVQADIDAAVTDGVETVNRLAAQIADLNRRIADAEGGGNANDYRDRRDRVLKELAEIIGIRSYEKADGQVVVSVAGGRPLVEGGSTWRLQTQANADGHTDVLWSDGSGGAANLSGGITGGRIGGWLHARDTLIAGYQNGLDALADGLRDRINSIHASGYGLSGTTGTDLFTGTGAADLGVNPDVLNNLDLIAASSTAAGAPGNADNALAIYGLRSALTMNGGNATFDGAYNTLVSQVGHDVQAAAASAGHQADMMTYLENYRESVSGVSLDEEMVNLVKFEAAYNAAAKMISMADDMLKTLIEMAG